MPVARRHIRLAALLTVLAAGSAGVLAVAQGQESAADRAAAGPRTPQTPALGASTTGGSVLQIVAHPDDDLFFMNPDLVRSVLAGTAVTTTYLTSGEADGINQAGGNLKDPAQPADHAAYAEARQNGIRSAYAQMATGDRTSAWKRTSIPTAGGGFAEVDVLVAKPEINLVWLQMREAGSIGADRPESMRGLWDGRIPALGSQLTSGTPVRQSFTYTKDQAVATIAGILERYKPTTIRMQDPTPGKFPKDGKITDHQDHMYGARFAQAAAERYAAVADRPHFSVQNYLGYLNSALPHVLDPATVETKLGFLKTYAWMDRENHCGSPAGCGDRKVAAKPTGRDWVHSMRYSRGDHTSWLTEGRAGRLWAFSVLDGHMAFWTRTGPQAEWAGPTLMPGSGIDPGASAATLPDGRVAVLGTRTVLGERPQDYRREVVYAVQSAPDGPFEAWQSLGTPEAADQDGTSAISAPAVAVGPDGKVTAYVRDSARTLRASEQQPDGGFGPWARLGGEDLQSDPVTATDAAGRRHVYATTAGTVVAWIQPSPAAPLLGPFPTQLPPTTVPLTATPDGEGVRLWFRRPDSGTVRTALVTASGTTAPHISTVTEAGGRAGYGAVSVAGRLLSGRAESGTAGTSAVGGPPSWNESRMLYAGAPASILEPAGAATTIVLGLDAELHVTSTLPTKDPTRPTHTTWRPAIRP
ncbi:PIG-L family deacetylase [Streptomyces bambusae]|uniref:PIG-L family deacetylase n=1 Tax=Streptomyces bambusae TaxID=1550616 RepID=A0ABS6ZAJ8_9ACTN|nr:PIG-L family deacetylase [Streptomyces bambusae]MBW5483695.1 PIG-L family deacetylase [Streptomyces bambusae]